MAKSETGHEVKMCAMTCCPCNLDLKMIETVVKAPKYICKACGHVAGKADNLCQPTPLK
jgi:hypothetical protein